MGVSLLRTGQLHQRIWYLASKIDQFPARRGVGQGCLDLLQVAAVSKIHATQPWCLDLHAQAVLWHRRG